MRDLIIDMADFGGVASAGDEVVLSAPAVRGSSVDPERIITPQPRTLELVDGVVTVPVEVGPLRVTLKPQGGVLSGTTFKVTVPEGEGSITLRRCLENQFRYDPPVVSAVGEAADRAELAATAAESSAGAAGGAAVVAAGHADRAEDADESAHAAAGSAASATTALIRDEMDAKVAVADGHAQSAGQSASLAGEHAEATGDDRRQTGEDRQATGEDVDETTALTAAAIVAASLVGGATPGAGSTVKETAPGSGLYTIGGTQ